MVPSFGQQRPAEGLLVPASPFPPHVQMFFDHKKADFSLEMCTYRIPEMSGKGGAPGATASSLHRRRDY